MNTREPRDRWFLCGTDVAATHAVGTRRAVASGANHGSKIGWRHFADQD